MNICFHFKSLLRGLFDFRIAMQIPLPAIALGISMKSISKYPSRRPVFRPKIIPFLCPENAPQKCKWLQCVRLVINKRRSPTGDAAAPQRHPRASPSAEPPKGAPRLSFRLHPRAGADQAHTLPQTNRPLNRLLSLCKITNAGKYVCTTKSAAGSGAVPAEPLGIGYRFSPPRARLYAFALLHNTPAIAFVNAVAY